MAIKIYTCAEWNAKPPKRPNTVVSSTPDKIIFHHTYGHVPNFAPGETLEEAKAYARAIQHFHMVTRGWNDSGHNFLVTRGGFILEGRHGTISALKNRKMVISAHCPGQNDQPGIEHEHYRELTWTEKQAAAARDLGVWICQHTRIRPTEIYPHSKYYNTTCPAELKDEILSLRLAVAQALTFNPYSEIEGEMWRWFLWRDRGAIPEERPLANVRERIPPSWWVRYKLHIGHKV